MLPIKIMKEINFYKIHKIENCVTMLHSRIIFYQKRHFLVDFLNFQNDANSRSLVMPKHSNCQAQRSQKFPTT